MTIPSKETVAAALRLAERFWSRVDRSGGPNACWPWVGSTTVFGYGEMSMGPKKSGKKRSHQIAWILTKGPIPEGGPRPHGYCVCHRCDNPPCCNPEHLFLGTQVENINDKVSKNRQQRMRGELCGMSRLTADQVRKIRAEYARGDGSHATLARRYGVGARTIGNIITGATWGHIELCSEPVADP